MCLKCVEALLKRERMACARTTRLLARWYSANHPSGIAILGLYEASRLILARSSVKKKKGK
jgi:hypothetical protein